MTSVMLPPAPPSDIVDEEPHSPLGASVPALPTASRSARPSRSSVRHRNSAAQRPSAGLSSGDVRRILRRAGVKSSGRECKEETEKQLKIYLTRIMKHISTVMEYTGRKTVSLKLVERACKEEYNQTIYSGLE